MQEDSLLSQNIIKDGKTIVDKFEIKLNNYRNALSRLHETIIEYENNSSLSVRDGAIQRFEFTMELAWKATREYLLTLGISDINNPRAVLAEAYNNNIIREEQEWIQVLKDRNATTHIYDEAAADAIYTRIATEHIKLFDSLLDVLESK